VRVGKDRTSVRGELRADALPPSWYARPADVVARELLGTVLVSRIGGLEVSGRIVETEAYVGPHDDASHAAVRVGRTGRNQSMFGPPGIAYVYRIYGVHWCLNVVTDEQDYPAAVLIRAVEPLTGLGVMRARRFPGRVPPGDRALASGPGKLAAAFGIDGALDGVPLNGPRLWLQPGPPLAADAVRTGPRIGITRAADWPLRFCEAGSPWLSRPL
jgi:DNA-3-methyladenine glycosylase